ncbi:MAG: TlpA family protein disulfide reductase [Solirubrobacterales bacterium]
MRFRQLILVAAAALALIVAGCGEEGGSGTDSAEPPGANNDPGKGAESDKGPGSEKVPAALAANRAEANEILEEGSLEPKLEELKGFPVVVNQWGSWCPPCRAEFPYFAQSAEDHAADVGFVGVDMQDERGAAEQFLEDNPVPYPSIFDPDAAQIASLGGGVVSPTTVFIDEKGEIANVFQGAYTDQAQLEADIDKYLLNG